jgi:hypothetical protein
MSVRRAESSPRAGGWLSRASLDQGKKGMRTLMTTTPSPFTLDPYGQTMVKLWHAASARLTAGPESNDVLVQAAGHAVDAWLRHDALTPRSLLDSFSRPGGPLIPQLRFVGSIVHDPVEPVPAEPPRLWWWVVADAYYRRWIELMQSRPGYPVEAAS